MQHAIHTMQHAATGSVVEAAVYLGVSVLGLFGALAAEAFSYTLVSLFAIWVSATTFTLGIIEYRRSQLPDDISHGPEV